MQLKSYALSISDLCKLYQHDKLELNPPYQRRPAWRTRQREDLLESIFNGIPIPAVILYKTKAGRRTSIFEVMDGKQRLETILHFRYGRIVKDEGRLEFWLRREESKYRKRLAYSDLSNPDVREELGLGVRLFMDYRVPVVEYSGDLRGLAGQKIAQWEVFTKINSTGSRLTKNEIRHAHTTPLFHAGSRLESRWYNRIVSKWRVFSKAEADRYQYHEALLELCTVFLNGGISDRRVKLDEFMRADIPQARINKAERAVNNALSWARTIMGDEGLKHSRLSKKVDFYSFIGTLMELMSQKAVRHDAAQNRRARRAVNSALHKLARIDGRVARYKNLPKRERKLAEYVVATREATDQLRNRKVRHDFWYSIVSLCMTKRLARRRLFGADLKYALWNAARVRNDRITCPNPDDRDDCWNRITYEDAEVDHRKAYSSGGPTNFRNAQLLCKPCNSSKGGR
jgi:hypothetical protein